MRKKKKRAKKKVKDEGYMTLEKLKAYMDFATQLKIAQEDIKKQRKDSNK
jgi:hypothetical protein